MNIIIHEANGLQIGQRCEDGYINLTKMAQASDKKFNDYLRLDTTKVFLDELSAVTGIPVTGKNGLIQIRQGGNNKNAQGTWGHPQVAINCGQWCSAKFAVLVSQWVVQWMSTGENPLTSTPLQTDLPQANQNLNSILQLLQEIERQINLARLFRHTAHNITDQPLISKSINRVVHRAMHEQGSILNECLRKLTDLQNTLSAVVSDPTQPSEPQLLPTQKQTPHYLTLIRKEARLTSLQLKKLTTITRQLNKQRQGTGERLTENTLIRVAVDFLLKSPQKRLSSQIAPKYQPNYLSLTRKETRFRDDQLEQLTTITRQLNKQRQGQGERITENTLIRVAVDLLLSQSEQLQGNTEEELTTSLGL